MIHLLLVAQLQLSGDSPGANSSALKIPVPIAHPFYVLPRPGMDTVASRIWIESICQVDKVPTKQFLLHRDVALSDSIIWHDETPDTRSLLACNRALLYRIGAWSVEGFDMPLGTPWNNGAIRTALSALDKRADDSRTADLLAVLTLMGRHPREVPRIASTLAKVTKAGVHSAAALRGCSELNYRIADTAVVRRCAQTALREGTDSTWHLIRLANLAYDSGDSTSGEKSFFAAVASATDRVSWEEVLWHLQSILSRREVLQWVDAPPQIRLPLLRDLLSKRDVRDGRLPGARLAAHFERLRHAEKHFWIDIPAITEANIRRRMPVDSNGVTSVGADRWQFEYDDYFYIWLRYGKPDYTTVKPTPPDTYPNEYWHYVSTCPDRIIEFQPWNPVLGGLATSTHNPAFRDEDDNSPRAEHYLCLKTQYYHIWDPVTELPVALLGFAIKLDGLHEADSTATRSQVTLRLQQWDPSLSLRSDTSFARSIPFPQKLNKTDYATGYMALPSSNGVTTWSLAASAGPTSWGHGYEMEHAPINSSEIKLSDLVIGAPSQSAVWRSGKESIALNPLGSLDKKNAASLFFQTVSQQDVPDARLVMTLTSNGVAQEGKTQRSMTISVGESVVKGLGGHNKVLDLSRLASGRITFALQLRDAAGKVLAARSGSVIIR